MKFDIFGIGNPLVDIITKTKDSILYDLGYAKGSMNLVSTEDQGKILDQHKDQERTVAVGGSCANTMVMIAQLGGKSAFCGKVGNDKFGKEFDTKLEEYGAKSFVKHGEGYTGTSVILLTEDAERTMNTSLGMCQHLSKDDLNLDAIKDSKCLYLTGYNWDTPSQKEAVITALECAKKEGIPISFSLSDSFCVEKHKEDFQNLLDNYTDMVFCNEAEAMIMTGTDDNAEQVKILSENVNQVVLTLGSKGALIYVEGEIFKIEPFKTKAIDTTGAGDSFAAGYLYGIANGYTPREAGTLASYCASVIVSKSGPRYEGDLKELVKEYMK